MKITSQLLKTLLLFNQADLIIKRNTELKLYSLFCVRYGFSDNSMINFISALSRIFPGVDNVKNLAFGKGSINCYVNYVVYPYFKESLKDEVNNSPFIVTCFHESLKKPSKL